MSEKARIFSVVVPTLNASCGWPEFSSALLACVSPAQVLIIDSTSQDYTADLALAEGFNVHSIPSSAFNHGGTRQIAAEMLSSAEIIVYLTQDAILSSPDSIAQLMKAFDDPLVAAAYGRQMPRPEAGPVEAHARLYNYSVTSQLRDIESKKHLGIKVAFISNSFAAYRRSSLMAIGGFPSGVIFGEDTITAGRLLLAGYKIAYIASACVYHSHPYTWTQEFKRYFDIGVLHHREKWMIEAFGRANGEGKRFVSSEFKYLWKNHPIQLPSALMRTMLKFLGYQLGRLEHRMTTRLKRKLSMNQGFWVD